MKLHLCILALDFFQLSECSAIKLGFDNKVAPNNYQSFIYTSMGQHGVLDLYILSQEQFTDLFVLGIVKLISLGRIPTQIKIHCLHKNERFVII